MLLGENPLRIDISKDVSTLKVDTRGGGRSYTLRFDPRTLQNWYPYNNAYTFTLDADGEIQLTSETGIRTLVNELPGTHYLNTYLWYNKVVREDNKRIADFAETMGVHTPFLPYSNTDVNRGFAIVGDAIDKMSKQHALQYADDSGRSYTQNMESQSLRALSEQDNKLYARVGEVYAMLNTMRKVATVHGFGRPIEPTIWGSN